MSGILLLTVEGKQRRFVIRNSKYAKVHQKSVQLSPGFEKLICIAVSVLWVHEFRLFLFFDYRRIMIIVVGL